MTIYTVAAFCLLFAPLFAHRQSQQQEIGFMSLKYTSALRAVAILMVMQQHLSGFVLDSRIFTPFGGGGVAIFLIVSGFGLSMSAQKKGVKDFWKKKFVRVFLPWILVWLIITIRSTRTFGIGTLVSLFSPNWFLQYLFVCYAIFYVCYKCAGKFSFALYIIFSLVTFFLLGNRQAEQCVSFQIGVLLAQRENILCWVKENVNKLLIVSLSIFILTLCIKQLGAMRTFMEVNYIIDRALNLTLKMSLGIFVMMACAIWFKHIDGKYTQIVGAMSYELYLVHLSFAIGLSNEVHQSPIAQIAVFCVFSFAGAWILFNIDTKISSFYSKHITYKSK